MSVKRLITGMKQPIVSGGGFFAGVASQQYSRSRKKLPSETTHKMMSTTETLPELRNEYGASTKAVSRNPTSGLLPQYKTTND